MTESTWFVIAIIIYMFGMLAIGYWSYKQTDQYDDYVLAGRGLPPFVAALSAGLALLVVRWHAVSHCPWEPRVMRLLPAPANGAYAR